MPRCAGADTHCIPTSRTATKQQFPLDDIRNRGIDPEFSDTLMHDSGNIMKNALKMALADHLNQRYIRPVGYVDTESDGENEA